MLNTCDGVGENLELANSLEKLDWWAGRRRMLLKLAANSTHIMQVMDLLQLHHLIKEPAQALKQVGNQVRFDKHVRQFREVTQARAFIPSMRKPWRCSFSRSTPIRNRAR